MPSIIQKIAFVFLVLCGLFPCSYGQAMELGTSSPPPPPIHGTLQVKDELAIVRDLVSLTEKNLEAQRNLCVVIEKYRKEQNAFLEGDKTSKRVRSMASLAKKAYQEIHEQHLEHLFGSHFIEELSMISSMTSSKS